MKVIKNILSKGVSELIDELLCKRMDKLKVNSELLIIDFAEIDMYNHIRINTNDFEKQAVEILYICLLAEIATLSIFIRPTKEINSIFDEDIDLGHTKKLIDIIIEMLESGTIEKSKFQNNTLSEILDIGDNYIQINNGTWEELNVRHFKKYIQIFEEQIKLRNINLSDAAGKTAELIKKYNPPQPFEKYLIKEQRHKSSKLIGLIKNRLANLKDIDIGRIIHLIKEQQAFIYSTDVNLFFSLCNELEIKVVESTIELDPNYKGRYILRRTISNAKGDTYIEDTKLKEDIIKLLQEKTEKEK